MAVVLIIAVVGAIALGMTGYVRARIAITRARSEIAALESALESYKSDWGYYPRSLVGRISSSGGYEASNNWYMLRALNGTAGGKTYMKFNPTMLQTNNTVLTGSNMLVNVYDPWGGVYNYYCSPKTAPALSNNFYGYPTNVNVNNGYQAGGQVNVNSFDLFSYGPDRATFVATTLGYGYWSDGPWFSTKFRVPESAVDDVTNWGK